jgi:hypothetical protein
MTCQEGQVLQEATAGQANISKLYRLASFLAVVTIFYNILEGVVSVYFGVNDDALSLFGFGLDSFVEVVSGIGVWHMICSAIPEAIRTDSRRRPFASPAPLSTFCPSGLSSPAY